MTMTTTCMCSTDLSRFHFFRVAIFLFFFFFADISCALLTFFSLSLSSSRYTIKNPKFHQGGGETSSSSSKLTDSVAVEMELPVMSSSAVNNMSSMKKPGVNPLLVKKNKKKNKKNPRTVSTHHTRKKSVELAGGRNKKEFGATQIEVSNVLTVRKFSLFCSIVFLLLTDL